MSISICMLSNLYPPVVSGSSTHVNFLSRELVSLGHHVVVITSKVFPDSSEYEVVDGVHIYRLPAVHLPKLPIALNFPWLNFTFTYPNFKRVQKIIQKHRPDIFHTHNHMFDLSLMASLLKYKYKRPLVCTIHTVLKHAKPVYNLFLYPSDRLILKNLVINRSDIVICPDFNIETYVKETFGKQRTALIPYGIFLSDGPFDQTIKQIQAKYNLEGKRVILSLGHVHEIRNRVDLIKALPCILEVYPDIVLLIVGALATKTPVLLANELRVSDHVIFTGDVPHHEVPAYLSIAELEAHWLNQESPDKTSLGIASLEAMGYGKVVLSSASENSYGPGLLQNGMNYIRVPVSNPEELAQITIDLLGDPGKRELIGSKAQSLIQEHFSWGKIALKTQALYMQLIA